MPRLRRFGEAGERLSVILLQASAGVIEHTEVELRGDFPLVSSFAEPFSGFFNVRGDTLAFRKKVSEVILRLGVAFFGGF